MPKTVKLMKRLLKEFPKEEFFLPDSPSKLFMEK